MKTKFPVMMAGAVVGALFILGATIGQAAAWDHRDGGSRYGGPDTAVGAIFIGMITTMATTDTGAAATGTVRAGMARRAIAARNSGSTFLRRSSSTRHIQFRSRLRSYSSVPVSRR